MRSAQVHALAPMMQFSVAPWRVLDAAHLAAVKQAVALRMRFTPRILELAQAGAATGEPILRPLAYVFPDGGLITGPIQKTFSVPLGRLLYFERQ